MIQVKCGYDKHGFRRAVIDKPFEKIAWYLEQDIQGSVKGCDIMLGVCKEIEQERLPEWSGTGNAHTMTINRGKVLLENEYADTEVSCSLSDFKVALETWKNFLVVSQNSSKGD